jgi:hypothetical protein
MVRTVNPRRVIITTLLGILAGVLLWWAMSPVPVGEALTIVFSRGVLGFVIGISGWRVFWAIHGLVLGAIVSLPQAIGAIWTGAGAWGFWGWLAAGAAIGFGIEVLATPLFHAGRIQVAPTPRQPRTT